MTYKLEVVHTHTWDSRTGEHSPVTDIVTEETVSRVPGHVNEVLARAMLDRARRYMQATKY